MANDRPGPRAAARAHSGFRLLAVVTTIATFLEIVLGGTVRATGSGEACPDWPACNGSAIPRFDQHVLIEYSHRLTASLVTLLVVLLAVAAFSFWRQPRYLRVLSAIAVGLLVAQVLLGSITVLAHLPPQIVTAHLATATALLGVLTTVSMYAFTGRGGRRDPDARRFARLTMLTAAGTFVLILTGSYVVGSNAGLGCHTWPLCNGEIVPTGGHASVDINFLHRAIVLLVGLAIAVMAVRALRTGHGRPLLVWTSVALLAAYLGQALIGAGNVWLQLAAGIRIAHLAAAQAIWMLATALTVFASVGRQQAAPEPAIAAPRGRRLPAAPSSNRRPRFGDRVQPADRSSEREGR